MQYWHINEMLRQRLCEDDFDTSSALTGGPDEYFMMSSWICWRVRGDHAAAICRLYAILTLVPL